MKRTHGQFIEEVYELVGDEYIVIDGEYKNAHTKIKFKHIACGNEFDKVANNFLTKGQRCPKCARKKASDKIRKTHEQFVQEMRDMYGDEFVIIGTYQSDANKIKVIHTPCGSTFEKRPNHLLKGSKCAKCSKKLKKSTETFKKEVRELVGDEYVITGAYVRNNIKISMMHRKCGKEFEMMPVEFLRGQRCPHCKNGRISKSNLRTHDEFVSEVFAQVGDEYSVVGEYTGSHNKILLKHNTCESEFKTKAYSFINGSRCPRCIDSKGVTRIIAWLDRLGIKYEREYRFDDCKYKRSLPFDIALLNKDNTVFMLIEYDGEQHFKPIDNWGGQEGFEGVQIRDGIKNDYCMSNRIPLLRIGYTEFNRIEEILEKELGIFACISV